MAGGRGRGRGRGRARPRKLPVITFGSSVGGRMQPDATEGEQSQVTPVQMGELNQKYLEPGSSSKGTTAAKTLQLSPDLTQLKLKEVEGTV